MSVCPVCGNRDGEVLYSVDSGVAARRFAGSSDQQRMRAVRSAIEVIWGQPWCDYVRCPQCSFGFAHPFVAATPAFYAAMYVSGAAYSEWKWEFERTVDALTVLRVTGNLRAFTLLDIGAGAGGFASRVPHRVSGCQGLLCTEYSDSAGRKSKDGGFAAFMAG